MLMTRGDTLRLNDWFCADEQTEILTTAGWRTHNQVNVGDLVASLDLATGIATWVPVQRMNRFPVEDAKMLRVQGKSLSALVTEGHRWPVRQRTTVGSARSSEWQIRTSDQLTVDSSVLRSAPFALPSTATTSDALVELVGWAWTEGSYRTNGGIHLSQSPTINGPKCDRIAAALTALFGPARPGREPRGVAAWSTGDYEGTRYWRLNAAASAKVSAAAPDRVLDTSWLLTLTNEQLDLLIDVSMLADGTTRVRGGHRDSSLSQNRRDRAEAFQFAAILAGRATSLHQWSMRHQGRAYPMWRVSLLEKDTAKPLRQAVAQWTTHTGTVWCPTVEHGTWLCRRDGLVHWTGNCGAGGATQGAHAVPGIEPVLAANHDPLAIETHSTNFPDVEHFRGDIRDLDVARHPYAEIFWASPECFTAGHFVTTARGQVPIEDVRVGDLALTHEGRWRPVVRVQSRVKSTVVVKGAGHPGIEVTPNHRFWARASRREWRNDLRDYRRVYDTPGWLPVEDAPAAQALWSTPVSIDPLDTEAVPAAFGLDVESAWWLVGRWVGDGSLTFGRNHEVLLACGFHETDELRERLAATGFEWAESRKRTATIFSVGDEKARDWLHEHFGHGAANKALPSWALSLPVEQRQSLLDGYLSADGSRHENRISANTVSRGLAVTVRLLAESLGHRVGIGTDPRTTYSIEGRTGVARPQWIVYWNATPDTNRSATAFEDEIHAWSRIRSVAPGRQDVAVYNIEVAEDHSYVLDGIVVANCTNWSQAKGRTADYAVMPGLFGDEEIAEDVTRSRALMQDVIRYLEGMTLRQQPVLAGVVENVTDIRKWVHWDHWRGRIERLGYRTRLIALNSMHAASRRTPRAPQSRDRLYLAYWHTSLRRDPDWDRWLRPAAWCPSCEDTITAVQVWRKPGVDMGRYRQQYDYRCPKVSCRGQVVEPEFVPAAAAIDWSLPGTRIGDRAKPLAEKTRARILAGAKRYARPIVIEAGGHQYDAADPKHPQHGDEGAYYRAWPVDSEPLKTLHTALTKGVAIPPMLVPVEGRDGKQASPAGAPLRTQTSRNETGVLIPPVVTEFRGGGSIGHSATEPISTLTAGGNHHGLVIPPLVVRGESRGADGTKPTDRALGAITAAGSQFLLIPPLVMRNNTPRGNPAQMVTPASEELRSITTAGHQSLLTWGALYAHDAGVRDIARPLPTQTTIQGDALLTAAEWDAIVDDCLFRMLEPHEIHAGMAFIPTYVVLGSKRQKVKQLGNAVTPPVAEVLVAALVECIQGHPIDWKEAA